MYLLMMPWGRVGSNLLLSILNQHNSRLKLPNVQNEPTTGIQTKYRDHGQQQVAEKQKQWMLDFESQSHGTDHSYLGANLAVGSIVDWQHFQEWVKALGPTMVYLDRKNTAKTVVSSIKATAYLNKTGESGWSLSKDKSPLSSFTVPIKQFISLAERLERNRARMDVLRKQCPGLKLWYEDINFDLHAVVLELFDHLQLPLGKYDVTTRKATGDNLSTEIENFDQLISAVPERFRAQLLQV